VSDPACAVDLVTGGSGYFGGLLVRMLRQRGRRVRIFDLNDTDDRPADVEFQQGDIRDAAAVRRACAGARAVFHCVAQVPLAKDKALFWSVNRDGTANLLSAAREAGAAKVVYVSSSAVFGVPKSNPVTPDTPPGPAEDYGAAKLEGETLCRKAADAGLDVSIIRPRTIMGHGRLGIMQMVFEWVAGGRNVYVLGSGANRYQFVHADDLADACLRAADRPGWGVYNIGAAEFGSMRETLEGLVKHAGTDSRVVGLPAAPAVAAMKLTAWLGLSPLAPYHWIMYGKEMYFDLAKPMAELGWKPRWGNVAMFAQSYDWYLANRERILAEKGKSLHKSAVKEGILKLLRFV
jgi:nucleoside-diphosphate-sugar epimerase